MPTQLTLPGIDYKPPRGLPGRKPPARGHHRKYNLFFAILPQLEDAKSLAALRQRIAQEYGVYGKPLAVDRLHVSLHGLGAHDVLPPWLVQLARMVASSIIFPEFEVVFDRARVFHSKGLPYVLCGDDGVEALKRFRRELGMAMANMGMPVFNHFEPHMTLAYGGPEMLQHPVMPVRWVVRDFVLINSHYGKTYYEELGRWSLHS